MYEFVHLKWTIERNISMDDLLIKIDRYISENKTNLVFIDVIPKTLENGEKDGSFSLDDVQSYMSNNKKHSFSETLFSMIDNKGMTDSIVYNNAGINRRVFSNIRCNPNYIPLKKNVFAICIALKLSLHDAEILLSSAGYAFNDSKDFDLIIKYCLEHNIYSFVDINEVLEHFGIDIFDI